MTTPVVRVAFPIALIGLVGAAGNRLHAQHQEEKPPDNPAFVEVDDDPDLPRVLLIGDSISIDYTLAVRAALAGKANVHRPPTNCGPTTRGLEHLDEWLGDDDWDVIHFNWGLHDLKFVDGKRRVPLDEYTTNLRRLVARLKKSGAKLIWCSTTPVPEGVRPSRTNEDVLAYNERAAEIMEENDIVTDDLYAFARPRLDEIQKKDNVHFSPEGSQVLAREVARTIEKWLPHGTTNSPGIASGGRERDRR